MSRKLGKRTSKIHIEAANEDPSVVAAEATVDSLLDTLVEKTGIRLTKDTKRRQTMLRQMETMLSQKKQAIDSVNYSRNAFEQLAKIRHSVQVKVQRKMGRPTEENKVVAIDDLKQARQAIVGKIPTRAQAAHRAHREAQRQIYLEAEQQDDGDEDEGRVSFGSQEQPSKSEMGAGREALAAWRSCSVCQASGGRPADILIADEHFPAIESRTTVPQRLQQHPNISILLAIVPKSLFNATGAAFFLRSGSAASCKAHTRLFLPLSKGATPIFCKSANRTP
ncbi:hypothetical protein V8E36_004708 [Tilletia maclaganii]